MVDDAFLIRSDSVLDGQRHLVGKLVETLQKKSGDVANLDRYMCLSTTRPRHFLNIAESDRIRTVRVHIQRRK